jgi:tetraacyldisaccharide 4'-kinase
MNHRYLQSTLAPILKPVSKGYAAAMRLRSWLFAHGIKSSVKPEAFCISVGNISWGGSGKTPLVSWLINWAQKHFLKPVVLTRGYGGKSENRPLLVKATTPPDKSGDEPLMLAQMHPHALILADPDRKRALRLAQKNYPADACPTLYILDDGMQHLALQRDLNLVVLKENDLKNQWNKVIPLGSWREGKKALARAGAFLLRLSPEADANLDNTLNIAAGKLREFNIPLFSFDLKPTALVPLQDWPIYASGMIFGAAACAFYGKPYTLCTGVGNPLSVRESAKRITGLMPAREFFFADHHKFTLKDLKQAGNKQLPVIITAKDAVKIQPLLPDLQNLTILVLHSELEFGPALFTEQNNSFEEWLDASYQVLETR